MIYLASTSSRRKALLKQAGISFCCIRPSYEEFHKAKGNPSTIVKSHALNKALCVFEKVKKPAIILAADTLIFFEGRTLGKPATIKQAHRMLDTLQGKLHWVYTGVALLEKVEAKKMTRKKIFYEKTRVKLKRMTKEEIQRYCRRVKSLDKAGGYAIQAGGSRIVSEIQGSFSNVVGLPMEALQKALRGWKRLN